MTGRDNIDDAAAVIASLRAEVAAQRELMERAAYALTDADWTEWRANSAEAAEVLGDEPQARRLAATLNALDAIRAHLAGAAVPAASEPVATFD